MTDVTVLGLGNMGSALARAFIVAGHSVTVWNRTSTKAEALRDAGATVATTPAEAVSASSLIVVCMMSYANLDEQLRSVETSTALKGRALVNLMLGTAAEAREAAQWAAYRDAVYLEGAIPVYPGDIGQIETSITYAGDRSAWDQHGSTLMALGGRSAYLGHDVAEPNVLENALSVWFYHVAHLALLEAAGVARSLGAGQQAIEQRTEEVLAMLERSVTSVFDDLRAERWTNSQATVDVHQAALETARADAVACSRTSVTLDSGISLLKSAGAAGLGDRNLAAMARWLGASDQGE